MKPASLKYLCLFALLLFFSSCKKDENPDIVDNAEEITSNSVAYYGGIIEFEFSDNYTTGQFVNGDYWVHNNGKDVIISQIKPASKIDATARIINGTMLNPSVSESQGYDSEARDMAYVDALNVDPGHTNQTLIVAPGNSVVKSRSMITNTGRPIISDAAILTVLAETPPDGAFRPSYVGTNKSIVATTADLNYEVLGKHAPIGGEANLDEVARKYERVWLEHNTEWTARDIHPNNNMPSYGRDITTSLAEGLLLLQLDYSDAEKERLLINMVQYGLDIFAIAQNGGQWNHSEANNLGRKMPLLLAAKVLGHDEMLNYADKEKHFIFQDDQNHFYISQTDVDISNSTTWSPDARATLIRYEIDDIGRAEWGIRAVDQPEKNNKSMDATYRNVCGPGQTQHILAAHMMGVKTEWNWSPAFDYADYYYENTPNEFDDYFKSLWQAYRN